MPRGSSAEIPPTAAARRTARPRWIRTATRRARARPAARAATGAAREGARPRGTTIVRWLAHAMGTNAVAPAARRPIQTASALVECRTTAARQAAPKTPTARRAAPATGMVAATSPAVVRTEIAMTRSVRSSGAPASPTARTGVAPSAALPGKTPTAWVANNRMCPADMGMVAVRHLVHARALMTPTAPLATPRRRPAGSPIAAARKAAEAMSRPIRIVATRLAAGRYRTAAAPGPAPAGMIPTARWASACQTRPVTPRTVVVQVQARARSGATSIVACSSVSVTTSRKTVAVPKVAAPEAIWIARTAKRRRAAKTMAAARQTAIWLTSTAACSNLRRATRTLRTAVVRPPAASRTTRTAPPARTRGAVLPTGAVFPLA